MKVICIGSHPDDIELGMGGTIAKHVHDGDSVKTILCTMGGVCGDPKTRKQEALAAGKILGVKKIYFTDFPVSKLNTPNNLLSKIINEIFENETPDRIYTHSPFDNHQVHVNVTNSVISASKKIKQIFFYEVISSTNFDFKPNAFVDVTQFINLKIKSIKAHKSQNLRFYLKPNVIKSLANTRYVYGKVGKNSKGYAEAFFINKYEF
jgi:LmbE family N-acetylglucosaminyl deacetylase